MSSIIDGLTIPLFVAQNLSLAGSTWYLATLYLFVSKRKKEQPWIWALLTIVTCLIVYNTIAICYSNGVLFVESYGTLNKLRTVSFYLKSCIALDCLTLYLIQAAYIVFITRLWSQLGPRWLKYIIIPMLATANICAFGGSSDTSSRRFSSH